MADTLSQRPSAVSASVSKLAASQILNHEAPKYTFSFTPFLFRTYRHGIDPNRPICKSHMQGFCPAGSSCPDKHISGQSQSNFNNLVCKHWLKGLCKKGESCEFLHEFNLRKMPECNFFVRHGYCANEQDCLYLHINPADKLKPCPHYDKGFCHLGPLCAKKHVRKKLCEFYLAGFCPAGKNCKQAHPKWPKDLPKATVKVARDPEEILQEQNRIREHQEREEERRQAMFGDDEGGRGRGRGRWRGNFGGGRGGGGDRGGRGRGRHW